MRPVQGSTVQSVVLMAHHVFWLGWEPKVEKKQSVSLLSLDPSHSAPAGHEALRFKEKQLQLLPITLLSLSAGFHSHRAICASPSFP